MQSDQGYFIVDSRLAHAGSFFCIFLTLALMVNLSAGSTEADYLNEDETRALLEKCADIRKSRINVSANFKETRKKKLLKRPIQTTGKIWFEPKQV